MAIADRDLNVRPFTNQEMLEILTEWRDAVAAATGPAADPMAVKFANGAVKYLTARPVLLRDFAQAADTRFDAQGV